MEHFFCSFLVYFVFIIILCRRTAVFHPWTETFFTCAICQYSVNASVIGGSGVLGVPGGKAFPEAPIGGWVSQRALLMM